MHSQPPRLARPGMRALRKPETPQDSPSRSPWRPLPPAGQRRAHGSPARAEESCPLGGSSWDLVTAEGWTGGGRKQRAAGSYTSSSARPQQLPLPEGSGSAPTLLRVPCTQLRHRAVGRPPPGSPERSPCCLLPGTGWAPRSRGHLVATRVGTQHAVAFWTLRRQASRRWYGFPGTATTSNTDWKALRSSSSSIWCR